MQTAEKVVPANHSNGVDTSPNKHGKFSARKMSMTYQQKPNNYAVLIDILAEMREYILWYNVMYFYKDVHWQVRFLIPVLQSKKEYWNPAYMYIYVYMICIYTSVITCNNM